MYVTLADFMLYGKYTTKTHFIHSMFVKKRRLEWICRAECLFYKEASCSDTVASSGFTSTSMAIFCSFWSKFSKN